MGWFNFLNFSSKNLPLVTENNETPKNSSAPSDSQTKTQATIETVNVLAAQTLPSKSDEGQNIPSASEAVAVPLSRFQSLKNYVESSRPLLAANAAVNVLKGSAQAVTNTFTGAKTGLKNAYNATADAAGKLKAIYAFDPLKLEAGYADHLDEITGAKFLSLSLKSISPFITECLQELIIEKAQEELNGWEKACGGVGGSVLNWVVSAGNKRFENAIHVNLLKAFCRLSETYKAKHPDLQGPITLENLLSMLGEAVLRHKDAPKFRQNLEQILVLQERIQAENAKAAQFDKELHAIASRATLGTDKQAEQYIAEKVVEFKAQYEKLMSEQRLAEDSEQFDDDVVAQYMNPETAEVFGLYVDRKNAKKAGEKLQEELAALKQSAHNPFSKELLRLVLPNGAADLELPEPLKELVWGVLEKELPLLLADISEELVGKQAIAERQELSETAPQLQGTISMAGNMLKEALPQFLANSSGSSFVSDLLMSLFSGSDAIKGVIHRRCPEQIRNIGASQSDFLESVWEGISTYADGLLTHASLNLSKFGAIASPKNFIPCDEDVFTFALQHLEELSDPSGDALDYLGARAMILQAQASSQPHIVELKALQKAIRELEKGTSPSKEADIKNLKALSQVHTEKLEEFITPITDLMKPLQESYRLHQIKKNCKILMQEHLQKNGELHTVLPQAIELQKHIAAMRASLQENEGADENQQHLLKEAEAEFLRMLKPLQPLLDQFREAVGLDSSHLLERFPFAGMLLENAMKELNEEIIPTGFLKLYTDVFLPAQNAKNDVAELQAALSQWFPVNAHAASPGIAQHAAEMVDSLVDSIDETAFAYLQNNAEHVSRLLYEAFPEYALIEQNRAFLQSALTQITGNHLVTTEVREYVRGLLKSAIVKVAVKVITSEDGEKHKKLLGCVGKLLSGHDADHGSRTDYVKGISAEIIDVLIDRETLDSLPLIAKDQLVEAAKTSILPSLLTEIQDHTTTWIQEIDDNREELFELTKTTHTAEACRVMSEYIRDFMPNFFLQNNPKLAEMLYTVIQGQLGANGQPVPAFDYLQANSDEARAFLSDQMQALAASQDPAIKDFYKGFSKYVEAAMLKIAVGVFKSIHEHDTVAELDDNQEERCRGLAQNDYNQALAMYEDPEMREIFEGQGHYEKLVEHHRTLLLKEKILERRLRLVANLLGITANHFEAIDYVRNQTGKSHGFQAPLEDKLRSFNRNLLAGVPSHLQQSLPDNKKDEIRINGFFSPLIKKLLEMSEINKENFALWEPVKSMVFELLAKTLLPNIGLSIGQASVEPENIDSLLINMIGQLNKSLENYSHMSYEELVAAATNKAAVQRQNQTPTRHERILKMQLGACMQIFFRLMPNRLGRMIIGIEGFKRLSEEQLGILMADLIRETPLCVMVDKMIESGLPSLHPDLSNDKWEGEGRDRQFVHYQENQNGEPVAAAERTFNFAEEPIAVKRRKAKETRHKLTDTLLECFKRSMHNLWRSLVTKVNVGVQSLAGRIGMRIKIGLDRLVQKVIRPIWRVLGILAYPVVKPVKLLWKMYVRNQAEALRNNVADPANEVLVQAWLNRIMTELHPENPAPAANA